MNQAPAITTLRPTRKRENDHTSFYASMRSSDVFISTYPKSGTTWLGFLLAHVFKQSPDEQLGLNSFNNYVPDVNLQYTKRGSLDEFQSLPNPRFFLCHAAYDANLPRVVYVLRDPRDVMLSYWHYKRLLSDQFNLSLLEFLESDDHWPCRWDEHVAGWLLPAKHPRLLVVKYEQMHKDAAGILKSVLQFAGVEASQEKIEAAVAASKFERMRAAEEKFGLQDKAGDPQEKFIRKGRVGSWREEMGPAELEIMYQKYGQVMSQMGYGEESIS
jgi:hypothetical protein